MAHAHQRLYRKLTGDMAWLAMVSQYLDRDVLLLMCVQASASRCRWRRSCSTTGPTSRFVSGAPHGKCDLPLCEGRSDESCVGHVRLRVCHPGRAAVPVRVVRQGEALGETFSQYI